MFPQVAESQVDEAVLNLENFLRSVADFIEQSMANKMSHSTRSLEQNDNDRR